MIALTIKSRDSKAYAETMEAHEYEIKAALLSKFPRFVEWPAEAFREENNEIILGILGKDPFGNILNSIKGIEINGKRLVIKKIKTTGQIGTCHILFVSSSEKDRISHILETFKNSSILTIGEMEGFVQNGGIINLVKDRDMIRFEINVKAGNQAGLKISSKLLRLATFVVD